jgi:dolichyl-phosphate-mannose-protein mannosyltransferase
MSATGNSSSSRVFESILVVCLLVAISGTAVTWFMSGDYLLYFGDAMAHLNIARRIVDSRTPGYAQIGTVWLPLPHLLMLPFVKSDGLWRSGIAGAIPSALCFVLAGSLLFAAVRRAFACSTAAVVALAVFVLNPNALYMQSIPMNEAIFFASLCALAYFTIRFSEDRSLLTASLAGVAALAGTLTRYEGWFLIPFVCLMMLVTGGSRRWPAALLFGAVASLGPLYWLGHNLWYYGDALEFYHGTWSAKMIYQRALDQGMKPYPGDGDLPVAIRYYLAAARLCAGWTLSVLGVAGVALAVWKRKFWPLGLLALPPVFYAWSMYSSGTPIFVPHLWPNSYYNTRYGLGALPLLAMGAGALACWTPARYRWHVAVAVVLLCVAPWLVQPPRESWITWKESEVNSVQRRAWTQEAARYLHQHYRGGGVITSFGDLTGIFLEAGIPLRDVLHSGNAPEFHASLQRPDLFLDEEWAVTFSGDEIATVILRAQRDGPKYECVKMIALKDAPVIEIYRRASQTP